MQRQGGSSLASALRLCWQSFAAPGSSSSIPCSSSGGRLAAALQDALWRMGTRDPKTRRGKVRKVNDWVCRCAAGSPPPAAAGLPLPLRRSPAPRFHPAAHAAADFQGLQWQGGEVGRPHLQWRHHSACYVATCSLAFACLPPKLNSALQSRPRKTPVNPYAQPWQPKEIPIPYPPNWQPAPNGGAAVLA